MFIYYHSSSISSKQPCLSDKLTIRSSPAENQPVFTYQQSFYPDIEAKWISSIPTDIFLLFYLHRQSGMQKKQLAAVYRFSVLAKDWLVININQLSPVHPIGFPTSLMVEFPICLLMKLMKHDETILHSPSNLTYPSCE